MLETLLTVGYAVLPQYAFLSASEERAVQEILERRWGRDAKRLKPVWRRGRSRRDADVDHILRVITERVLEPLQRTVRDEGPLLLEEVFVRSYRGSRSPGHALHADPGYLVFAYSFDRDGTLVYPDAHAIRTPPHTGAILGGMRRQAATGTPAVIHAAPASRSKRFALIAVFKPLRDPRIPRRVRQEVARRIATLR